MSHLTSGWNGTGKIRMGKRTEAKRTGTESGATAHPEKNNLSGKSLPLNGFYPKTKKK